jgi:hypothetical protein
MSAGAVLQVGVMTSNDQQNDSRLQRIQSLQFTDRAAAEALLLEFVRETFPQLDTVHVELRPLAVSLNSFNGFMTLADGTRLFYKTHVEPGSIVHEYYNSQLLADAGYPVIRPRYTSTEYGKQFLIYDVIDAPSVFDVAYAIEHGTRNDLDALTEAQNRSDDQLLEIYLRTLQPQSAEDAGKAAVHQLFHHRLGERYRNFYSDKDIYLQQSVFRWDDLLAQKWIINGKSYSDTLLTAIQCANEILQPAQPGVSVVGHGDAHNGNVFFTDDGLIYFDPAFGGRHHPLLDITKPIFHNVFATWMYHPEEVDTAMHITLHDDGKTLIVEHDYTPSACRRRFFESKIQRVLKPLISTLKQRGELPANWRTMLKSSLMCCPLLTMNLADRNRFSPNVGLLGLCYVVEMGLENVGERNTINAALDTIEESA